jgi:3-methyladenine DNA glycosylase/8-oxoguanine DNA glycosylase
MAAERPRSEEKLLDCKAESSLTHIQYAVDYLASRDAAMASLARKAHLDNYITGLTPFESLVHAVIYQQLSGRAARSVHLKLLSLFGGKYPAPHELISTPDDRLRGTGISARKVQYLKEIAKAANEGKLERSHLANLPDEKIIELLDDIRGVGTWTIDMLLIFVLGRPDVFPASDLGLRKAIARLYKMERIPSEREAEEFAKRWAPYRSVASLMLWHSFDKSPWQ